MKCSKQLALTEASRDITDNRAIALFYAYLTGNVGPDFSGWSDSDPWRCHSEAASGKCAYHSDGASDRLSLLNEQLATDTTEPLEIVDTFLPSLELSAAEVTRPVLFVDTEFGGDVHLDGEFASDVALINCEVQGEVVLHEPDTIDDGGSTVDLSFTQATSIRAEADPIGSRLICRYSEFDRVNLQRVEFTGQVDFSNARISGDAHFTDTSFTRCAEFYHTEFVSDAYFAGAVFDGVSTPKTAAADFSRAGFGSRAVFTRSRFPARASFSDAKFETDALFRDAVFVDDSGLNLTVAADFSGARIKGDACFYKVHFENGAEFNDIDFEGVTTFTLTEFVATAGGTFRSKAEFETATFGGNASFADCVFEDEGEFSSAKFKETADFTNASFQGKADMEGTRFKNAARFVEASFGQEAERNYEDEAEFSEAIFKGHADFSKTSFAAKADFRSADFKELATFWEANFTLDDDSVFDCSAQFDEADFRGRFECFDSTFDDRVTFSSTTFHQTEGEGGAWFDESRFHDIVEFDETRFMRPAFFRDVLFAAETSFTDTDFDQEAMFAGLKCRGPMTFDDVAFDDTVTFSSGVFRGDLGFRDGTAFSGEISLETAQFQGDVTFKEADITAGARFSTASFDGTLRLEQLRSAASVDLSSTEIGHLWARAGTLSLNLRDATVHKGDLKHTQLHGSDFSDSTLTDVHLEDADLRHSDLTGTDFEKVRINDETEFLGQPTGPNSATDTGSVLSTIGAGLREVLGLRKQRCYNDPYAEFDTTDNDPDRTPFGQKTASKRKSARDTGKTVYKKIGLLAEEVSRPNLQSVAFVRRQDLTTKQYRDDITSDTTPLDINPFSLGRWIRSRAARIIMLYGESPWRILFWSAFIVLSAGLIYDVGGYMQIEGGADPDLFDTVYYSSLIYTSLGFGDFSIVDSPIGRAVATTETLLGLTMLALLVFVLGRRAAR